MALMAGLREAITKDDVPADLHWKEPVELTPTEAAAIRGNWPVIGNVSFSMEFGPQRWDRQDVANFWRSNTFKQRSIYDDKGQLVQHIHFLPSVADAVLKQHVDDLAAAFKAEFPQLAPAVRTRFNNVKELNSYVEGKDYATSEEYATVGMALVLESVSPNWQYVLRGNNTGSMDKANTLNTHDSTVNTLQIKYEDQMFSALMLFGHHLLQDFTEQWIMERETGASFTRSYQFIPFPTPPYIDDPFADTIAGILGLWFTIIYMVRARKHNN